MFIIEIQKHKTMQAEPSFFEKLNEKIKNSVMLRMLGIAFLILILLIPSEMVMSILRERKYRQDDVIREVSDIWGRSQTLGGPVITIPYNTIYTDKEGKIIKTK
ncbi:MAG TPA: hypothetical protein DIU39_07030, partial [Flavobacteriales bacterium]|nr:hypothetical protein [Flavobacteriales bacterium]